MSCLMLPELPLSDHIAIELRRAARLQALATDVLAVLDPPVKKAASPASLPLDAGGSNPFPRPEHTACTR